MDTGPQVNPTEVDPDRWRPLLRMIPAVLFIAAAIFQEWLWLPDILYAHRTRHLMQAVIWGALLLFLLYVVIAGLWKWWHRPKGKDAILQATTQIAQILPEAPLVCRAAPQSPANQIIFSAFALICLGLALYGIYVGNWLLFFAMGGTSAMMCGACWSVRRLEAKARKMVLTFDPIRKLITFENFSFDTTFMPEKPHPREVIPFAQILDSTYYPGQKGGPPSLTISTTRGPTVLNGRMENFETVRKLLESIITLNLANPDQHRAYLRSVPKIEVPWFGWVILFAAVGSVGILIWYLLTKL